MYKQGCSIIFFTEDKDQVEFLFFLRDNKDEIPYPNTWDLLGGNLEENESPEDCITREMWEEIGIVLSEFKKFRAVEFLDRLEHTFYKRVQKNFLGSYNENNIILKRPNEGQLLKW
ncbi:MAG: NUDIX domain-containing protein, partial [Bacteroidota bacterium]